MNRAIGRVGTAVIVLMLLLVGQLTYLQVIDAKQLADDPRNSRTYLKDFTRPRGEIISADGKILAKSVPAPDEYKLQRVYPFGELFAQVVGYQSVVVGSTGVEKEYTSVLSGRNRSPLQLRNLGDLLLGKDQTGNVVLSLRTDVQLVAKTALGNQQGSVVVINPRTGALIAMYSNPSFDPQPLAGHDPKAVQAYWQALNPNSGTSPLLPRAYRERYPPGSTFKIATTAAALDTGTATPASTFPVRTSITPPQAGRAIQNFGGESCGGALFDVLRVSCNSAGRAAAARSKRASSTRATRRSPSSGSISARSSHRSSRASGSTPRRRSTSHPAPPPAAGPFRGPSQTTSRRSRLPGSGRATSPPPPCRWRSSARRLPTPAR